MDVDVEAQISAVRRELGDREPSSREHETGKLLEMRMSQVFATTAADLWEAVTDADRIRAWFLPVSGELRPGGRYRLEGNASGTVEGCDPPHWYTATWEFGGGMSWIEVQVKSVDDDHASLTLVHLARVEEDMWETYGPGAVGVGWDGGFMGLGRHLASGEPNNPAEVEFWTGSDEGKRFTQLSSDAWGEASIAYGTDPEKARAAAERTRRFYTP